MKPERITIRSAFDEPGDVQDPQAAALARRRRIIRQVVPLLFSLALLIALLIYDARHPQPWQVELDAYLAGHTGVHAAALLTAERPAAFDEGMPFRPTGTSSHFRLGPEDPTGRTGETGLGPLPYPPEEVWCVLLATGPRNPEGPLPSPGPDNVILLVRHADLYAEDWIVYEAPPGADRLTVDQALQTIGCDFAALE